MSIFDKKPERPRNKRTLNDEEYVRRNISDISEENELEEKTEKLFNELKENINMANEIMPLLEKKCIATHIPVPEELQQIRAAVKRKDPSETTGSRISFALFKETVKKFEEVKLEYRLMISQSFSDNFQVNSTLKQKIKRKTIAGINENDFLIFTSLWLLNYLQNKYLEMFSLPNVTLIASAHSEGAGPAAKGAIKFAIAAAFAAGVDLLYDKLGNQVEVPDTSVLNSDENIDGGSRVEELAVKKIEENDYDIILDYAVRYIYSSSDQKYDPWVSYLSARQARNASIDAYSYYPTYSSKEFLKANNFSSDGGDYVRSDSDKFEESFERKIVTSFNEIANASGTHIQRISTMSRISLNTASQAMAYRITKDQICCFVRIMTLNDGLDRDTYKLLKGLINIYSSTLSVKVFESFAAKMINTIKNIDISQMLTLNINNMLNSMIKQMYQKYINAFSSTKFNKDIYNKCYIYFNFLTTILNLIDDLVFDMTKQLNSKSAQDTRIIKNATRSVEAKYEIRALKDTEVLLASILSQSLDECAILEDDARENIIDDFVTGFNMPSNQYTINISDEMRERYFSDSQPIKLSRKTSGVGISSEIYIPAIRKIDNPETSEEVIRNILRTCKIDVTDEQIKQMLKDTDGSSR